MGNNNLHDISSENNINGLEEAYAKSGITIRFFEGLANLCQNSTLKKGITAAGIVLTLTGLSACNGKIKEPTAPIVSPGEIPSQSDDVPFEVSPTPSVTASPVATPTPTEEIVELTVGQQWFFDYVELKEKGLDDIYAIHQANLALKNGELQPLVESGKIKKEDIRGLERDYESIDKNLITIRDDFLTGSYGDRELSTTEQLLAIYREDPITLHRNMDFINENLRNILKEGFSFISVIPDEESQKKVTKIVDLYNDIEGKDVSELDQLLNVNDLSWREGWYVFAHIWGDVGEPLVIYNGEEVSFHWDYFSLTDFFHNMMAKSEEGFNEITTMPTYEYCSPQK